MAQQPNPRRAALAYGKLQYKVFPVASQSKAPLTEHGYQDASADAEQIAAWWERWPNANVALACAPSGTIALDVDPHRLNDAGRSFVAGLEEHHPTATQDTPTGGSHYLYRLPPDTMLSNSPGELPPGIDVRVRGYILLAPSVVTYYGDEAAAKGVPDGYSGRYAWRAGLRPNELPPQPLPEHVLTLLKPKERIATPPAAVPVYTNGATPRYALAAFDGELDELARTPVGMRNEQLNRSSFNLGQLVAGGLLDEAEVVDKLTSVALSIGLEEREIARTIKSGLESGKQSPRGLPEAPSLIFPGAGGHNSPLLNEDGEALDLSKVVYKAEDGGILDVWLATRGANWVFVNGYDKWYQWCGTHWAKDETQAINAEIQELMQRLNDRAREEMHDAGDDKEAAARAKAYIAATKRSRARVISVEAMAQAKLGAHTADLNAGNVLNLANGVLDLDTLGLTPHDPARLMTYVLPYAYDPKAGCPRFRQFLREVLVDEDTLEPDESLILLIQELVGYTPTTDMQHEAMAWLSGEGGNGKTVFITVIEHLLGDLACTVDFQTLGTPGNYDLADLVGKRFVFSTESKRGGQFAEGLLRRLVSGETINTRAIYGSPFRFKPVGKIWWAMNDKPVVKDTSNATWRRMKLVPFNRTFTGKDKDTGLTDKLLEELPGILNWALDGLARLRENREFTYSRAADMALRDYRKSANPVAGWLDEETMAAPVGLFPTKASVAYSQYKRWAEKNGQRAENSTVFGRELKRLGIEKEQSRRGIHYGFALIDDGRTEPDDEEA